MNPYTKREYPIDGYYKHHIDADREESVRLEGTVHGKENIMARYDAYKVIYNYETITEDTSLPLGMPHTPNDNNEYLLNSTVYAIQPEKTIFVAQKSREDPTMGLWTFEGYDADSKVVNEENLGQRYPNNWRRRIRFIGKWKWSDTTEVPWYYDIYYETFDKTTGKSEWKLFKEARGGKKNYDQEVKISPDDFNGTDMERPDITGNQNEILGTHYVFDETYGSHRLSANAIDAIQTNPLKIYYRAAQHNVTYEYEGTVPNGAAALAKNFWLNRRR